MRLISALHDPIDPFLKATLARDENNAGIGVEIV